ncbi:MAG: DUF1573 domain-containing protein [Bacteroidota bacterium]
MKKKLIQLALIMAGIPGIGFAQPLISFSPDTIKATVTICNDSTTQPLTIYNTGSQNLDYTISINLTSIGNDQPKSACIPNNGTCWSNQGITNVTFNTINNSSGTCDGYKNYTNIKTCVIAGESYSISIKNGVTLEEDVRTWIDYNNDGVFQASEKVFESLKKYLHTGTVNIPITAVKNQPLRMRVADNYFASPIPEVCSTPSFYGQYEDYTIIILEDSIVTLSDTSGTLPGDSVIIDVYLNALGLPANVYTAEIIINSNDPVNPVVTIPVVFTVEGEPEIDLSDTIIDYDSIMQWASKTDTLIIYNTGCDTMFVTSITNSLSEYTLDTNNMTIPPFDSALIQITFNPLTVGSFTDTLNIYNNVVDTIVILTGVGTPSPKISYSPDSFNVTFTTCNDSTTQPLTIYNTGTADMYLDINIEYSESIKPPPCTPATTAYCCGMGIITVQFNTINNTSGNGSVGYENFDYISTTVYAGQTYPITINSGLPNNHNVRAWIDYDNSGTFEDPAERVLQSMNKDVHTGNITIPETAVLDIPLRMRIAGDYYLNSTPGPCSNVQYGQHEDYTVVIVYSDSIFSLSESADTIIPGDSSIVDVYFDASGLISGVYTSKITINSNDPSSPVNTIPLSLTVQGHPIIGLSNDTLVFDSILQYTSDTVSLTIYNTGCDTLFVTNITASDTDFTTDTTILTIPQDDSSSVQVIFTPQSFGAYLDTLTIFNNYNDTTIILKGFSKQPPIIVTVPDSFSVNYTACDDSSTSLLKIYNTGTEDLIFNIDYPSWVTLSDTADIITNGDSLLIDVKFYASGLLTGTHNSYIIVNSNDPLNPADSTQCTLILNGYPVIGLSDTIISMDTIMQWTEDIDTLLIFNTGCDTLFVTNMTNTLGDFSTDTTNFTLLPGDTGLVQITFSPTIVGTQIDTIQIFNNDIETLVILQGVGTEPPVISYNPDTFDVTITTCNDIITLPLTIYNSGLADLYLNMNIELNESIKPPPCTPATTAYCCGMGIITVQFNTINNTSGNGSVGYENFDAINTTVYAGQTYPITINSGLPNNHNVRAWIDYDNNGTFEDATERVLQSLNKDVHTGNITIPETAVIDIPLRMRVAGDYYQNSVPGPCSNVQYGQHEDYTVIIILSDSIFSLSEYTDTIPQVDSAIIDVEFNAGGLITGEYSKQIIINSNDPLSPYDTIPLILTVEGHPIVEFSDDTLVFDSILQYTSDTLILTISNTGCDTLLVTNITASDSDFEVDTTNLIIPQGDSASVQVVFNPQSDGNYLDTLNIFNNYNDTTIILKGYSKSPPNIVTVPDSLSANLSACDDSATSVLKIYNTGFENLIFDIDYPLWITLSDTADTISNGDSLLIDVKFKAAGLNTGIHNSYIIVNSNDPLNQADSTACTLTLAGYPILALLDTSFSMDTIMQWAVDTDTLLIYNTGCDTLFITNITTSITDFSVDTTNLSILMGDSGTVIITFNPATVDTFTCDLNIFSNDVDTIVMLYGVSTYPPVISYDPSSFTDTVGTCIDSLVNQLTISNSGLTDLNFDIEIEYGEPVLPPPCTPATTGYCCGMGIITVQFNTINNTSGNGSLGYENFDSISTTVYAGQTYPITINSGLPNNHNVRAWIDYDNSGTFEDASERVFQSLNLDVHTGNVTIPTTAVVGTLLRMRVAGEFWQNSTPGPCSNVEYGQHEDYSVLILVDSMITLSSTADTLSTGDTTVIDIIYNTEELNLGTYTFDLAVSTNDPLYYNFDIPMSLTIEPVPAEPSAANQSACEGDSVPDLTATGTNIKWYSDTALAILEYSGSPFPTGHDTAGTYIYHATQTQYGCESAYNTVSLTINPLPSAPTASDTSACEGDTIPDLTATGANIKWYSDTGLTTLVYTGSPFTTGDTASGVYNYYVTQTVSSCEGPADTASLTIYSMPPAPTAADKIACEGGTIPDLTATGTDIKWYSDPALTILEFSGDTFATGNTTAGTYTYYATQTETVNSCESLSDTVTLTIYSVPAMPPTSDESVCEGGSVPDLAATGTDIKWYSDPALTILEFSDDTFATGQTAAGIYDYYVTQTVNTCESPADTATLTIYATPAAPAAADTSACENETIPDFTASGTDIKWYSDPALTILEFSGDTFATGHTVPGAYTYYVTETLGSCAGPADTVTLSIYPLPVVPVASDETACEGGTIPDLTAAGTDIKWYSDPALTTLVFSGSPFATGETIAGTYTYYVTQTEAVNGCESPSDTVTLTIYSVPAVPTSSDETACEGGTIPDLTATGTDIKWYSDPALTILEFSGSPFATGETNAGIYTYYVTQTVNTCESPSDTVTLIIYSVPAVPTISDEIACEGGTIPDLTATGTDVKWYSDPALTTLVFSGSPFVTGETNAGTYSYYVTQTVNTCESPSDTITLTIYTVPAATAASDEIACEGGSIPDLTATGTDIKWYSDPALTMLEFSGSPFATGETTAGTYTYYVIQTVNACESPADTVSLTIYPIPTVPVASDETACEGTSISDLTATGTDLKWYSDPALTILVFSGSPFVTGETATGTYTYYVTQTVNTCESPADTVLLTIYPAPAVPVASDEVACEGGTIPDLTATGTDIKWYSDPALTTLVFSGSPFATGETNAGTYTYYVTQTEAVNNCESPSDTITLTIYSIPAVPTSADETACEGGTIPDLTATGTDIKWYSDPALTTLVFNGSPFATGETTAGTYTYYITQTVNTCESLSDTITLTIYSLPAAPISSDETACEGDTIPDLAAAGTDIKWYSDPALTILVFSGSPFATGETSAGTFTYYVTQTINACESPSDTVALTIYPVPATPASSDEIACEGGLIPELTATGTDIKWYSDSALTTLEFSGDTFSTGYSTPGTYTYYVTQTEAVNGCESPSVTVTLTIYSLPATPTSSNTSICVLGSIPDLTATGTDIKWYSNPALTTLVFSGSPFATGETIPGTYTYYVTQTVNTCESPADTVTLTILSAPVISADPDSFNVALACADTLILPLTIYNNGGCDLDFNITEEGAPGLDTILNRLNQNYSSVTSAVPFIYNFIDGVTGNNIDDGGGDMYDWGNYLSTDIGGDFNYSDNMIVPNAWLGDSGKYFTRKHPGLFVFAADMDGVSWFEINGNLGADGDGNADAVILTLNMYGTSFKGLVKRVYNAGDPSINHLIIVEDKPLIDHTWTANTNDDQHRVTNLSSTDRIYHLLYASLGGGYIDDAQTLNIMKKFLEAVGPFALNIPLSAYSDTVTIGDSSVIDVQFNSTYLNAGQYNTIMIINSNDPLNPVDSVPVTLNVTGDPEIELSDTCLYLDSIIEYTTNTESLWIYNTGCDTLFITGINNSLPEFSLSDTSGFILPGDSVEIIVTFAPVSAGFFQDNITIFNNDEDTTVCLSGYGYPKPVISADPDSFDVTLACVDSVTLPLTIYNTGGSDLDFDIVTWTYSPLFNLAYIANSDDNTVSVLDITTNTMVGAPVAVGSYPWRVSINPDASYVYVSNRNSNNISVIRISDNTVTTTIPVGDGPTGLAFTPNGNYVYVGNRYDNNVMVIDCSTNTVVDTITTSMNEPQDIVITPDGSYAYVANRNSGVAVIETATNTVVANIGGIAVAHSITITPDGRFVYVSESMWVTGSVQVIETATNTIIASIGGDFDPAAGLDITPDGNFVYVVDRWNAEVDVIDVSTNTIVNTISDGRLGDAWGLAISPYGDYAYVTYPYGAAQSVVIIDISTNTVIGDLSSGSGARGIASLNGGVPWLAVSTNSGSIPPGDSTVIDVAFNSTGLNIGQYNSDLIVYSNDPLNPADTVPTTLNVVSVPEIELSDTCLDLDTTMQWTTITDTFWIYNNGCGILTITDMTTSLSEFSTDTTALTILQDDSAQVTVSFTPTAVGNLYDTLIIFNDDVDTTICLSGYAYPPPVVSTTPDSFDVTMTGCCDSKTLPLTVYNTGGSDLLYNISSDSSWISFSISADTVAAGDSSIVDVTFDGCVLTPGVYAPNIIISSNDPLNPSDTIPVTVTKESLPPSPASSDTSICFGDPASDLTATGTIIQWYDDPLLDTVIFSGSPFASGDTAVGIYTYYVTQTIDSCEGTADTVTLTINAGPPVPAVSDTTICFGDPTPDLTATGTNIQWYSDAGLTTLVSSGSTYASGDSTVGIYYYYVTDSIAGCTEGQSDTATLTINLVPAAPASSDMTVCYGEPTPNLIATGTNIKWYSDSSLSTLKFVGDTFASGDTTEGIYTYYATDSVNGCTSPYTVIALTIAAAPTTPVVSDTATCFGDPAPDLVATGTYIQWYSDSLLTNWVFSGDTFASGDTAEGIYTYYVTDSISGCAASPAGTATLTINAIPSVPVASDTSSCFGDTPPDLTATGTNIQWYSDPLFDTLVYSGDPFTTGETQAGTYTWYATQTVNGCESPADMVTLIINATPAAPVSSDTIICFGDPTPNLTATGSNIQWYSDPLLDTLVSTGSPFATGDTTVGIHTYYVTQTIDNCEGTAENVTLTINAGPPVPTASDTTICFGDPTPDLAASGTNIQWYSDPLLDTLVYAGSAFTSGDSVVGIYNYYVTDSIAGCIEGLADTATLTINLVPAVPASSDTAICYGEPVPNLIATGTNIKWYSDSSLSTLKFIGDTFASGDTAEGIYTYYATDSINGCTSPYTVIALTITAAPTTPVVSDTATCFGDPAPDLVATGTYIQWYSDTGLSTLEFAGDTFATGETASGTYTYYVTDSISGCAASPAGTATLTINAIPPAPVASDTSSCFGDTPPNLTATGTNIQWYSDPLLDTLVYIGDPFTTGETDPGTYTYYVTQTVSGCESPADTVTMTIYAIPAPTSSDTTICFGDPTPDLAATGTNIKWYSDSLLDTLLFSGNPFATGKSAVGIYRYHVTDSLNGCESPGTMVTLTINAGPGQPAASDTTICFGDPTPDLSATGTNIQWYDDPLLDSVIYTGSPFTTGETAVGIYTWYVTDSILGCSEGPADTVTLTINAIPSAPVSSYTLICFGDPTPDLSATGSNIQWYDDPGLGSMVFSGNPFSSGDVAVGIHTYYATQTVSGCESPGTAVTLTINAPPAVLVASDTAICFGDPTPDLTASGLYIQWYSDTGLTTLEFAGDTFATGETATGTYTYYVTDSVSGCPQSPADTVILTINAFPSAPVASDIAICIGDTVPDLVAVGDSVRWYSDPLLDTMVYSGGSFATGHTASGVYIYYVTQTDTITLCESPADTVTLAIYSTPAPSSSDLIVCFGDSVPDLVATGVGIRWYSDSFLDSLIFIGDTLTLSDSTVGSHTYFTTQTDTVTGCESPATTVTLTINAIPAVPATTDETVCEGGSIPDLIATGTNNTWYSDTSLSIIEFSGDTFATGQTIVGTYTYYITQTVLSCESPADTSVLTISPTPSAPTASDESACEGSTIPDLIATGTDVKWYSDSSLTVLADTGNTYATGQTVPGTYTYYVTDSLPGCPGLSASVRLTIIPMPVAPTATDTTICYGEPTPDLVATGSLIRWYDDPLLQNLIYSGDTLAPVDTAAGIYMYYATQTDALTLCEGPAITVSLTINAIPSIPTASDEVACEGSAVPDLVATGINITWYSDSVLSIVEFNGDTFTTEDSVAGIYTYYVTQTILGCESPADTVLLSILSTVPAPTASDETACVGGTIPDLSASGSNIQWYNSPLLDTVIFTGSSFATGETAVGTYTWYVTDSVPGCGESGADTVTLTINSIPSAPLSSDKTVCFGEPTPDLVTAGTNIQWYSDSLLTVLAFSGDIYATGNTVDSVYTYYATQIINSCESQATTVILTIKPAPPMPAATDVIVCWGDPVPDLTATGTNIQWYSDPLLDTLVFSGSPFATGDTVIGTYTYYVVDSSGSCFSPVNPVTLTITSYPILTLSDTCLDLGAIIELTSSTDTLFFFNPGCDTLQVTNITNSTPEYSVDTTSLTVLPGDTGQVIVSFSPAASGIYLDTLNITSNDVDATVCLGGSALGVPVIAALPDSFNVSFNGCCDSSISTLAIYNTGVTDLICNISTDSIWLGVSVSADSVTAGDSNLVAVTFNGCILNPGTYTASITIISNDPLDPIVIIPVTLVKDPLPASPTAALTEVCFGDSVPALIATGGDTILWYDDPGLTNLVFVGDTFATGDTAIGASTYYITSMVDSCESLPDSVTLAINTPASAPVAPDTAICFSLTAPTLIVTGTYIQWYSDTGLSSLIFSGDTFPTGDTAAGVYTYYVTDSTGGCLESPADTATLTIIPAPVPPVASADTIICFSDPIPSFTATGDSILWYNDPLLITPVFSGDTFAPVDTAPGVYTYYVTQTDTSISNCQSPADSVVLTINGIPSAPTTSGDTAICLGNPAPEFTATGSYLRWYDDSGLTSLVFVGDTFQPTDTTVGIYTYYVTDSVAICSQGPASAVTLTINVLSTVPAATDTTICYGDPTPDLVATGTYIKWYSDSDLANLVFSGDTFPSGDSLAGIYTFYVTDSIAGCSASPADTATLTINALPAAPIANDTTICFGEPTPDLVATGVGIRWYNDSLLVFTGDTFASGDTATGIYTYYVTQTDTSVNNCESPADTVILTINPIPSAPTSTGGTECEGNSIPDLTAIGTNIQWYSDAGLTVLEFSGNTYATVQTAAGTYIYYVTQTILGCESPANTSTLIIMPTPPSPTASDEAACEGGAIPDLTATGTNINWYSDSGLTNWMGAGSTFTTGQTTPGIYTYYVNDSLPGCPGPATTVTLTINTMPGAPTATDITICYGDPTPDLISTGTNVQWYKDPTLLILSYSGNTFATGITAVGTYTWYVTQTASGCGESQSDTVSLTINPKPLVTLNTYSVPIALGDSVTLIAYNASTYSWSPPAGLNTDTGSAVTASPDTTTTYTVTGTNDWGCSNDASVIVIVKGTWIDENTFVQNLSIYPNPTRDEFVVDFISSQSGVVEINLQNSLGQILIIKEIESDKGHHYIQSFDVKDLGTGIYNLQIVTDSGVINSKVVVFRN